MSPRSTIRRFPVAFACVALSPAIIPIVLIFRFGGWIPALPLTVIAGFFAALAAHCFAEARMWPRGKNKALATLAALCMAPHFLLSTMAPGRLMPLTIGFLVPGLILLTISIPFLAGGGNLKNTRYYAWRLTLTMLAGLLAPVSIQAAVRALSPFFGGLFPYMDFAATILVPVGPVLALFFWPAAPQRFGGSDKALGRDVFFTGFMQLAAVLLLPLLYWKAYLSLTGWEKYGALDFTIPVVGALAITCHMLAGTTDEGSSGYLRAWRRYYRAAVALPMIAILAQSLPMAMDLYDAIAILLALWIIGAGLYAVFSRRRPVAVPMTMLAAMLILAGFGPLNARTLLDWNRLPLFEKILVRNGIMTDGRIIHARKDLPRREAKILDSLIDELSDPPLAGDFRAYLASHGVAFENNSGNMDCLNKLASPCGGGKTKLEPKNVLASLGLWRETYFEQTGFNLRAGIDFQAPDPEHLDVEGFDYLYREVRIGSKDNGPRAFEAIDPPLEVSMNEDGQALIFTQAGGSPVEIDFAPLSEWLLANSGRVKDEEFREIAVLDGEAGGLKLRLYPYQISLEPREDGWALRHVVFALLIGAPPH